MKGDAVLYIDLASLPHEHPMRNAPLDVIAARFRWIKPVDYPAKYFDGTPIEEPDRSSWKYVESTWVIGRETFNTLGEPWKMNQQWQGREPALAVPADAEYPPRP